jgi:hypothetical protein
MTRARKWPMVVVVLMLGLMWTPVSAISPSAVMVYGGNLEAPILLRPANPSDFPAFSLLWWNAGSYLHPTRTVQGESDLRNRLGQRPYLNLAIFWGRYDADELQPEHASQHGRFYLPTSSEPAIVVSTIPDMQKRSSPVPGELGGFAALWTLSPEDQATLKGLGFPGLEAGAVSGR